MAANIVEEHTSKKCSPYATGLHSGVTRPFWGGANAQDLFQNAQSLFPGIQGCILVGRDFCCFSLDLNGKVDVCGRDDLFFTAHDFGAERWRSADVVTFFFALHLILGGKRT